MNEADAQLKLSSKRQGYDRLGGGIKRMMGGDVKLAENATYVDFSETGVSHRYFKESGQKGNPYLKHFYATVLNGLAIDFNTFDGIKEIRRGNGSEIYVFRGRGPNEDWEFGGSAGGDKQ